MVKVRDSYPLTTDGKVDVSLWLQKLVDINEQLSPDILLGVCEAAQEWSMRHHSASDSVRHLSWAGHSTFEVGLEMAQILAELKLDSSAVGAGILYRTVREGRVTLAEVERRFGGELAKLIDGVQRMAAISSISTLKDEAVLGQLVDQKQNLRKMLIAMIDDVRVALIKLAERTCAIRAVKLAPRERQMRVSQEIMDIYAPLAHRLGIGHIKWELEDLAFRYLEPAAYKQIAGLLFEKRLERDDYINQVVSDLEAVLNEKNIKHDVNGRAKHIFSIWRKMKRKNIDFYQVYDVRAVRVLVPSVGECYETLGLVHSLWHHIPKEFDDYIATPKENGYRSLHTAVLGPDSKVLEVQIRTFGMHEEAELGVCAHWHYKEGTKRKEGASSPDSGSSAASSYDAKIAWLRQVLQWQEEVGQVSAEDIVSYFQQTILEDRIYVFTPEGHVIDLAPGATPVDFAYHVHTEVGHRCRGALVNGSIVPLSYSLQTGEQVKILTIKEGRPSRDWLNQNFGYIKTHRARTKIQAWFRLQDRDHNITYGRQLLERELDRLQLSKINWLQLAAELKLADKEEIQAAVGSGDLRLAQFLNALQRLNDNFSELTKEADKDLLQAEEALVRRQVVRNKACAKLTDIEVEGVGNLVTHLAGCCKPVPGDALVGYISVGKGIGVHRSDCAEFSVLASRSPERVLEVNWREEVSEFYSASIFIRAYDRQGLLSDISTAFSNAAVNVVGVNTRSLENDQTANMHLSLEVRSLSQLQQVLDKVAQLPGILEVYRETR